MHRPEEVTVDTRLQRECVVGCERIQSGKQGNASVSRQEETPGEYSCSEGTVIGLRRCNAPEK